MIAAGFGLYREEDANPLDLGRTPVAPEAHVPAPAIPRRLS